MHKESEEELGDGPLRYNTAVVNAMALIALGEESIKSSQGTKQKLG